MSINYAVLGILSLKSLAGYDIKKIIQASPFMYWSGNNNQIYKALVELHADGFVTSETHHQDGAPSKKIYAITPVGLAALHQWSLAMPEPPETKKPFLVQLAWTWQAGNAALIDLLDQYARDVEGQLHIARNKGGDRAFAPDRTPREHAIWQLIYENAAEQYQHELDWIDRVRTTVANFGDAEPIPQSTKHKEDEKMRYTVVEKENGKYLYLGPEGRQLLAERDGLDLISLCAENDTTLLLIHGDRLSEDFFRLRTGVAGAILQKFAQYNIRAAVVLDTDTVRGKFREYLSESNRGPTFRSYASIEEAEGWLLGGQ